MDWKTGVAGEICIKALRNRFLAYLGDRVDLRADFPSTLATALGCTGSADCPTARWLLLVHQHLHHDSS